MWSRHDALGKARKGLSRHKEVLLKLLDHALNEATHGERLPCERQNEATGNCKY